MSEKISFDDAWKTTEAQNLEILQSDLPDDWDCHRHQGVSDYPCLVICSVKVMYWQGQQGYTVYMSTTSVHSLGNDPMYVISFLEELCLCS